MRANITKDRRILDIDEIRLFAGRREDLVIKYAPLVNRIVERMRMRIPHTVSREELISAGIVGLLDALDKFNSSMGVRFETYAWSRIKGAILDELRKMDWVPRSVRKDIHRIEDAIATLSSSFGREPDDSEIAREIGVDINAYHKMLSRMQGIRLLSLDMVMPDGSVPAFIQQAADTASAFDVLKVKEIKKVIYKALSGLSPKEQLVIALYYYEELTLKEIAKILGLTESRISQIHTKAIIRLRVRLKPYQEKITHSSEDKESNLAIGHGCKCINERWKHTMNT